jgi:hypothetical protein
MSWKHKSAFQAKERKGAESSLQKIFLVSSHLSWGEERSGMVLSILSQLG